MSEDTIPDASLEEALPNSPLESVTPGLTVEGVRGDVEAVLSAHLQGRLYSNDPSFSAHPVGFREDGALILYYATMAPDVPPRYFALTLGVEEVLTWARLAPNDTEVSL